MPPGMAMPGRAMPPDRPGPPAWAYIPSHCHSWLFLLAFRNMASKLYGASWHAGTLAADVLQPHRLGAQHDALAADAGLQPGPGPVLGRGVAGLVEGDGGLEQRHRLQGVGAGPGEQPLEVERRLAGPAA